ncbi:hypothetical protein BpHYR1_005908 [Brachionus plicatilis]|uniref:Transposase Tc1-like domain-containing protein n=1 Tax=Brachionus plicatilis TaxID=10195 RepID=A0A3M7PSV9_BRAPC|nr:hypothetical protein BpHYR1_005908 [Brachionus plicatilis]
MTKSSYNGSAKTFQTYCESSKCSENSIDLLDSLKESLSNLRIDNLSQRSVRLYCTTKRNFQATSRVNNFGNCRRRPKLSNRDISRETVRRVLAKKGFEFYSAVKKPLLTASDSTKRYKWIKERRNWTDKYDFLFLINSKLKNNLVLTTLRVKPKSNLFSFRG